MITKSLKDISWLVTEEEYRADPAISYSTLAKYEREGFSKLNTLFDRVESPSLTLGSAVDSIITGGFEEFNERFFVAEFPEISDTLIRICNTIFNILPEEFNGTIDEVDSSIIESATTIHSYQLNWKSDTRVKVVREKCKGYFDMLFLSQGKQVLSSTVFTQVMNCVSALKESPATNWYFQEDTPFENVERLYQLKFKGEYKGIPMRCMMDECIILHDEKVILPIDLKTSYKPEYKFPISFIEWHYFTQAMSYSYILKQNLAKDEYFKDFKVLPYRFIVVNKETLNPLVWEFSQTFSEIDIKLDGAIYPNWRKTLTELNHYLNDKPSVPDGISLTECNNIEKYFENECN